MAIHSVTTGKCLRVAKHLLVLVLAGALHHRHPKILHPFVHVFGLNGVMLAFLSLTAMLTFLLHIFLTDPLFPWLSALHR